LLHVARDAAKKVVEVIEQEVSALLTEFKVATVPPSRLITSRCDKVVESLRALEEKVTNYGMLNRNWEGGREDVEEDEEDDDLSMQGLAVSPRLESGTKRAREEQAASESEGEQEEEGEAMDEGKHDEEKEEVVGEGKQTDAHPLVRASRRMPTYSDKLVVAFRFVYEAILCISGSADQSEASARVSKLLSDHGIPTDIPFESNTTFRIVAVGQERDKALATVHPFWRMWKVALHPDITPNMQELYGIDSTALSEHLKSIRYVTTNELLVIPWIFHERLSTSAPTPASAPAPTPAPSLDGNEGEQEDDTKAKTQFPRPTSAF
jgi:hypothetical protein